MTALDKPSSDERPANFMDRSKLSLQFTRAVAAPKARVPDTD